MLNFDSDYMEGAHPLILERLVAHNMTKTTGYGCDEICAEARRKVLEACGNPDSEVHFLVGGTQTNTTVIKALLRPHEGVVAASTGHIAVHESGAIESTGHKVLTLPSADGKITAEQVARAVIAHREDGTFEHMVQPKLVYISNPTEYGTLYTLSELTELSEVCRSYGAPLYMDGARLGYGLMSDGTDVTLSDVAKLCDVFYIGGTKVGALCGEAVVFPKGDSPKQFMTMVKQHGALLAKGRVLGIQFDALFDNALYFTISRSAIERAKDKGYRFFLETPTNQVFIVLENAKMRELQKKAQFSFWEQFDETHTVVRFATDWATTKEEIDLLLALL